MAICHDVLSKVKKLTNPLAMLLLVVVALVVVVVYTRKISLLSQTSFIIGNIFYFIFWKIKFYYQ